MISAKSLVTSCFTLVLFLLTVSSAAGVILSVQNGQVDARLNNTVSVDITVDSPAEITGSALTVKYDTQELDLISVESNFFTFENQLSTTDGVCVDFGANQSSGASNEYRSNYIVFFQNGGGTNGCSLDPRFQQTTLTGGMMYYTDRTYTLTSVPSKYVGMKVIKTPNNDLSRADSRGYMNFEIPVNGIVYVAYDSRAASLPNWMNGFTYTGDKILTSLSTQPSLKVYSRTYTSATNPLMVGPETASGKMITATRVQAGQPVSNVMFNLTFDVSNASVGTYAIDVTQSSISNTDAGYNGSGELVSMLTGALAPVPGQDLTNPAVFPEIPVSLVNVGTITVSSSVETKIINKPAQPLVVESGSISKTFSVVGGSNAIYTWTAVDSNGAVIEVQNGSSYSFAAPASGNFAGVYTITVTNNQGFSDSFEIKVPLTVSPDTLSFTELKLDGSDNPQYFTVTGTDDTRSNYTWEILPTLGAIDPVSNPENFGIWQKASPIYYDSTNSISPADIESWQSFYIRVTVANDPDLTSANGLNKRTVGPITIIPLNTFSVILNDSDGVIDGTLINAGDITVREISTDQTKSVIANNGEVSFLLPNSGGTFQYEIKDNRISSIYRDLTFSTGQKISSVTLLKNGVDVITGLVEDYDTGLPVVGATVYAYQLSDIAIHYSAITDANGLYNISLPEGAPLSDWIIVASHNQYISHQQDDISAGTVNFIEAEALMKAETVIKNISAIEINGSVRIDITAIPAISNVSEVDFVLENGIGSIGTPSITDNVDAGSTFTILYDKVDSFTATIQVDTGEDHDPNSGFWISQSFDYAHGDGLAASSYAVLGSTGGETFLTANGQVAEVNIPPGGVAGDTSVIIEQVVRDKGGVDTYAYEITAYDSQTGMEITDDKIDYIEVTLPLDLSVVKPGDLENGIFVVYHAEDLFALEANSSTVVPGTNIISTDYIGDGQVGSVTFSVDSLSIFEVSSPDGSESTSLGSSNNGGCFINTSSNGKFINAYLSQLQKIKNIFLNLIN